MLIIPICTPPKYVLNITDAGSHGDDEDLYGGDTEVEDNDESESNSLERSSQNTGNADLLGNSIIKQEVLEDSGSQGILGRGIKLEGQQEVSQEVDCDGIMGNSASQEMIFGLDVNERIIKQEIE